MKRGWPANPARTFVPTRFLRRHLPVGAVAVVAVMVAALTGAVPMFAGMALAAQSSAVTDFRLSCTGDTLDVAYVVEAGHGGIGFENLRIGANGRSSTANSVILWIPARGGTRHVTYNVSQYPADAVFSVEVWVGGWGGGTTISPSIAASSCAPPPVVPEAPAAVLLPLSLLVTTGTALLLPRARRKLAVVRKRRRDSELRVAGS